MDQHASKLRFPRQLRTIPLVEHVRIPPARSTTPALVEHDGRTYPLAELLACLPRAKLERLDAMALPSGQAMWNAAVRCWPGLAAEIVAGTKLGADSE